MSFSSIGPRSLLQMEGPADAARLKKFYDQNLRDIRKFPFFKEKQYLYNSPPSFTSWQKILGSLFLFQTAIPAAKQDVSRANLEASLAASYCIEFDSPVRCISKNLTKAFFKTSIKNTTKPPLAFEHFIINLPKGLLTDDFKVPIDFLIVMTLDCFKHAAALHDVLINFTSKYDHNEGNCFVFGFAECGTVIYDRFSWSDLKTTYVDENSNCADGYEDQFIDCCEKMRQITVNTFLTMSYEPELLLETKSLPVSVGHSFSELKSTTQARNNIWIGKDFISQSRERIKADESNGSPRSPHWRRGHWHTFLAGPKHKERKQILKWVQPVYVSGGNL
nr:hypothetical protein [uncultured Mediterranean phage uvMED]